MTLAESDGDRKFTRSHFLNLAHHRNIAVERRSELPVHREVVFQVLPSIARTYISATRPAESAIRGHRHRRTIFPRDQDAFPRNIGHPRRVPCSAAVHMRRHQCINLQSRYQFFITGHPHPDQHHWIMRIVDDLLRHRVTPVAVARRNPHPQCIRIDVSKLVLQVALFLMEKGLAIGNQKLHVANLRTVNGRGNKPRSGMPCETVNHASGSKQSTPCRPRRLSRSMSSEAAAPAAPNAAAALVQPHIFGCGIRHKSP